MNVDIPMKTGTNQVELSFAVIIAVVVVGQAEPDAGLHVGQLGHVVAFGVPSVLHAPAW